MVFVKIFKPFQQVSVIYNPLQTTASLMFSRIALFYHKADSKHLLAKLILFSTWSWNLEAKRVAFLTSKFPANTMLFLQPILNSLKARWEGSLRRIIIYGFLLESLEIISRYYMARKQRFLSPYSWTFSKGPCMGIIYDHHEPRPLKATGPERNTMFQPLSGGIQIYVKI